MTYARNPRSHRLPIAEETGSFKIILWTINDFDCRGGGT